METPCINICQLNAGTGLCEGCGRTGAEIASWVHFTPTERRAIIATLPDRLVAAMARAQ